MCPKNERTICENLIHTESYERIHLRVNEHFLSLFSIRYILTLA